MSDPGRARARRAGRRGPAAPVLLRSRLLALAGGLLALGLEPSTGADTLASRSSDAFKATDDLHRASATTPSSC